THFPPRRTITFVIPGFTFVIPSSLCRSHCPRTMMIALCASALLAGAPAAAAAQAATYTRDVPDSLIGALLFGDVDAARAAGDQAVAADNTFFCNYFGLPAI